MVKEFAITDQNLELTTTISTRTPFFGPTGIPFSITQPVQLVRYSTGGQYIAVVTGKIAQVFHSTLKGR